MEKAKNKRTNDKTQPKEQEEGKKYISQCRGDFEGLGPSEPSCESVDFLLLPLGGGSKCVRLYVTVRVTTCRTLTAFPPALRGVSIHRIFQSEGEKGECRVRALRGESVIGE
jgi:hypothetical protein